MFSLIISIISIALVAALAAATVYFGGAAFNKGTAGADASAFINAGQQIAGAFTLAATDSDNAVALADLADGNGAVYLSQIPTYKGAALLLDDDYVLVEAGLGACTSIVSKATGEKEEDVSFTAAAALTPSGLFNCVQLDATGATAAVAAGLVDIVANDYVAFYKVK